MTDGCKGFVPPKGSPHTARMCCSNCDVSLASKVWCPLLCGRGASSLTTMRPSCTNISTASKPTRPICSAMPKAKVRASVAVAAEMRAGESERWRMWFRCRFSAAS